MKRNSCSVCNRIVCKKDSSGNCIGMDTSKYPALLCVECVRGVLKTRKLKGELICVLCKHCPDKYIN